jgi:hypothetical protein
MTDEVLRVATWNVGPIGDDAEATLRSKAAFASEAGLDLLLLQNVRPRRLALFRRAAGFDWALSAADLQVQQRPSRLVWPVSAIAGRGGPPRARRLFTHVPHPQRMLLVELATHWGPLTAVTFDTESGILSQRDGLDHTLALARWLEKARGTVVVGTSTEGPRKDAPERSRLETQLPTGSPYLRTGEPGDDLMLGPRPIHELDDALRVWFDANRTELSHERRLRPDGPLAMTYVRAGGRYRDSQPQRRDALWITRDLEVVRRPVHDYEGAVRAGSDHALVYADLRRELAP